MSTTPEYGRRCGVPPKPWPQHHAECARSIAHAVDCEIATCSAYSGLPSGSMIGTGGSSADTIDPPSSPKELSPQHITVSSSAVAHVKSVPAASDRIADSV